MPCCVNVRVGVQFQFDFFYLPLLTRIRFQTQKGICAMLLKFTNQGIRNAKDSAKRAVAAAEMANTRSSKPS